MACKHKFIDDLYINYAKDWKPEILIVGTFNPEWTDNNSANWFYGRTENNYFWKVLPELFGEKSMLCCNKNEWVSFCKIHKIAITDLIECITTANKEEHRNIINGFSDKAIVENFPFKELTTVTITDIIKKTPSIKQVYLTRGASQGLWKKLWNPVKEYCKQNNIYCEELITPSGYAFYQYKKEERKIYDSLSTFILARWKEKWKK